MSYLDNLSPELRASLTKPSRHLVDFVSYCRAYRAAHPDATMNEAQEAYQATKAHKLVNAR